MNAPAIILSVASLPSWLTTLPEWAWIAALCFLALAECIGSRFLVHIRLRQLGREADRLLAQKFAEVAQDFAKHGAVVEELRRDLEETCAADWKANEQERASLQRALETEAQDREKALEKLLSAVSQLESSAVDHGHALQALEHALGKETADRQLEERHLWNAIGRLEKA